jgi:hypothetical protein
VPGRFSSERCRRYLSQQLGSVGNVSWALVFKQVQSFGGSAQIAGG